MAGARAVHHEDHTGALELASAVSDGESAAAATHAADAEAECPDYSDPDAEDWDRSSDDPPARNR